MTNRIFIFFRNLRFSPLLILILSLPLSFAHSQAVAKEIDSNEPQQAVQSSTDSTVATEGDQAERVDLWLVYQDSIQNDPQLSQAEEALRAQLERAPQARSLLLPSVNASLGYSWVNQSQSGLGAVDLDQHGPNAAIAITQPLYNRGSLSLNRQAKALVEAAQQDYILAKQSLVVRMSQAYFDVLAAEDNLDFSISEQTAIGRQLEQTIKRYEFGQISSLDVNEAQAMHDATLAQVLSARNALRSRREALAKITGQHYDMLGRLNPEQPYAEMGTESEAYWTELALKQSPAILALYQKLEVSRENIEYQRSGRYPVVALSAAHSYEKGDGKMQGISGDRTTNATKVGVSLTVPIYTGGALSSRIREAQYSYQSAQQALESARRNLVNQVRDAYWGASAMLSRIEALSQALVSATAAFDSVEVGYEVGSRTIVDVLSAQTIKHRAERDLKHARYDYLMNMIQLKAAAGTLTDDDLISINNCLDLYLESESS
jgi:outer membrane protein